MLNNIDKMFTMDIEKFSFSYFKYLKEIIDNISLSEIKEFVTVLLEARKNNSTIFFIGNGGSASTSSHFANDLSIGVNNYENPFKVHSLVDNVSIITALGNDFGYDEIFVRQLKIYACPNDIIVGISASGNSPNIIKAFEYANGIGIKTMSLTAFDGGKLKEISKINVHVPTKNKEYGPSEDLHMILDHLIGAYLMRYVKNES